jgi:RecJ-like exonuclease
MAITAKTCPRCEGTGHDKKGEPIVKMVPFDPKVHKSYIDGEHDQRRYHQTIKQGSGCLMCGGIGYIELVAS